MCRPPRRNFSCAAAAGDLGTLGPISRLSSSAERPSERHMAEWCATTWGAEPAASEIREWVRPAFRIISGFSAAARAPNGIADDRSPENTKAVEE